MRRPGLDQEPAAAVVGRELKPLGKMVVGAPGDRLELSAEGLSLNGRLLSGSRPQRADAAGRPLPHYPFGRYRVHGGGLSEAIVNAVAHRDYSSNASVQVMLAEPMFLARYVEKAGSGILDMIGLYREAGPSARVPAGGRRVRPAPRLTASEQRASAPWPPAGSNRCESKLHFGHSAQ